MVMLGQSSQGRLQKDHAALCGPFESQETLKIGAKTAQAVFSTKGESSNFENGLYVIVTTHGTRVQGGWRGSKSKNFIGESFK